MKAHTKKISSFIFILLGFTPLLFTLVITIRKDDIFKRMKEKMETHSLQTITLPEDEVVWMDDHEIWVNEQMFDIHTKKLQNGIYTFTGLYDAEETILVKKERNSGEKQDDNSLLVRVFKCLKTFYCESATDMGTRETALMAFQLIPAPPLPEFSPLVLTPPPRITCHHNCFQIS